MNLDLKNKNALVCGSSRGIGKSAAIELSKMGANITLVSRNIELLSRVMRELAHTHSNQDHDFLVADFSDSHDLKKKVKGLISLKTIHVLVNNTGGPPAGAIIDAEEDAFKMAFNNHLICNHILTQLVTPGMKKASFGRIINVISTSVKQPLAGLGVSNTIRAAVANWAKTMANELGIHGITVNNVLPGYTETERLKEIISGRAKKLGIPEHEVIETMKKNVPLHRFGDPTEIAIAVAFLASPAASYINGINLPVDGGRTKSL